MNTIITEGLSFALPLFIMAVGGIYSERSGITNLALEGFQGFGALTGAMAASSLYRLGIDSGISIQLAILAAALGGIVLSMLHALWCIRFQANQVISGVVINLFAMALTALLTKQYNGWLLGMPSDRILLETAPKTSIPWLSRIPVLGAIVTARYPFEWWMIGLSLLAYYGLTHSRFGLHLRACGENPQAVDAAGIRVSRIRWTAVLIAGACAGVAGISFAYSILGGFSSGIFAGYGYLAIAAFIFGNWRFFPTLAACLIFGLSRAGGYRLVQSFELPGGYLDLMMILPYVLTLFLLIFLSGRNRPPHALGEPYDKGKR